MLIRYLYSMSHQYETFLGVPHAKSFDNGVYIHGLGEAKQPLQSISIDIYSQYVGCLSQILYGEVL